jgi:hypothetical protein
MGSSKLIE